MSDYSNRRLQDAYEEIERLQERLEASIAAEGAAHEIIAELREKLEAAQETIKVLENTHAKLQSAEAKLAELEDVQKVWGDGFNWHDAFMDSQKERCRLNVEVTRLREALEHIAYTMAVTNDVRECARAALASSAAEGESK